MKSRSAHAMAGLLTLLIALVVVNHIAARHHARIDLTARSQYTLSPATMALLRELDDVVTIRVYFSFDMPRALMPLKRGVDDLLDEFSRTSRGKVRIERIDPLSDSAAQRRALMLGIAPVQLNVIERDRHELVKVYLGMVVMHADRMHVLPVVQTAANLEYRIDQAIVKISSAAQPAIGWLGPREGEEDPVGGGFGGLLRLLEERYEIARIDEKAAHELNPRTTAAVVVASPGEVSRDTLAMLDNYLMSGGKVLALIDRWIIGDKLTATPKETPMVGALASYGVKVAQDMVMDRSNAMAAFAGQLVTYHVPYPLWPKIVPEYLAEDDPITAELGSLVLPWTSTLERVPLEGAGDAVVLAQSTTMSAATSGDAPNIDPETVDRLLQTEASKKSYALALRLKGPFESAFDSDGKLAAAKTGAAGAEIVVVGSSRFAQNNFLGRYPENAVFIENTVDALAMGDRLIGVRSRIGFDRPIALVDDAVKAGLRALNVVAGPVMVAFIALGMAIARRIRRRRVCARFGG